MSHQPSSTTINQEHFLIRQPWVQWVRVFDYRCRFRRRIDMCMCKFPMTYLCPARFAVYTRPRGRSQMRKLRPLLRKRKPGVSFCCTAETPIDIVVSVTPMRCLGFLENRSFRGGKFGHILTLWCQSKSVDICFPLLSQEVPNGKDAYPNVEI